MNRNIKVPLGKKDSVLRYWWENVEVEAISKPVNLAIAYYARTGKFLEIGTVDGTKAENNADNIVKYIYIPNNSTAFNFLEKKKEDGERVATVIKFILRNSIKESDKTEVYDLDELRTRLEGINHVAVVHEPVPVIQTEYKAPVKEEPQPPPTQDNIESTAQTSVTYDAEQDEGSDLIAALLGEINFEL